MADYVVVPQGGKIGINLATGEVTGAPDDTLAATTYHPIAKKGFWAGRVEKKAEKAAEYLINDLGMIAAKAREGKISHRKMQKLSGYFDSPDAPTLEEQVDSVVIHPGAADFYNNHERLFAWTKVFQNQAKYLSPQTRAEINSAYQHMVVTLKASQLSAEDTSARLEELPLLDESYSEPTETAQPAQEPVSEPTAVTPEAQPAAQPPAEAVIDLTQPPAPVAEPTKTDENPFAKVPQYQGTVEEPNIERRESLAKTAATLDEANNPSQETVVAKDSYAQSVAYTDAKVGEVVKGIGSRVDALGVSVADVLARLGRMGTQRAQVSRQPADPETLGKVDKHYSEILASYQGLVVVNQVHDGKSSHAASQGLKKYREDRPKNPISDLERKSILEGLPGDITKVKIAGGNEVNLKSEDNTWLADRFLNRLAQDDGLYVAVLGSRRGGKGGRQTYFKVRKGGQPLQFTIGTETTDEIRVNEGRIDDIFQPQLEKHPQLGELLTKYLEILAVQAQKPTEEKDGK